MEEIIEVDGRQYRLSYDQPMTLEQRSQAIEEIRKSSEHKQQVKQLDNITRKGGTVLFAGMIVS